MPCLAAGLAPASVATVRSLLLTSPAKIVVCRSAVKVASSSSRSLHAAAPEQQLTTKGARWLCVIDFEATCDEKSENFGPQEIIEFPAVIVDAGARRAPVHEFRRYVCPVLRPRLTDFCRRLTGIRQEDVDAADTFPTVLAQFEAFLDQWMLEPEEETDNKKVKEKKEVLVVTCGNWDCARMLPLQCALSQVQPPASLTRWCDVKEIYRRVNNKSRHAPAGLLHMLKESGLAFEGRHHSGLDDARNTAALCLHLLNKGAWFAPTASLDTLPSRHKQRRQDEIDRITRRATSASPVSILPPTNRYASVPSFDAGASLVHEKLAREGVPSPDILLARAAGAGVREVVVNCYDVPSSTRGVALAQRLRERADESLPKVTCTVGVHPHMVGECDASTLPRLEHLASGNPDVVVALGECGLDFERNFTPRDAQLHWLHEQVKLALRLGLPLYLHERNAAESMIKALTPYAEQIKNSALIHCFTGNASDLNAYLSLGLYIGVTGLICDERRNKQLLQLLPSIPLNRLVLNTDSPFLIPRNAPRPRPKLNEPAMLVYIAEKVAEGYAGDVDAEIVLHSSARNAAALFGRELRP
eukprot:jgi/Chlat1/1805/Chrsp135S02125